MRIIGGQFRRRKLVTPPDATVTRPMPDMVREALFNLLRGHCEGIDAFDAFSGTGAVGLEAVSRGARRCVCIERDRDIAEILRTNVEQLGVSDRVEVVVGDALGAGALARCPRPIHLAFFDPPYPLVRDEAGWRRVKAQFQRIVELLDDTGYAVLRTPWPFLHETPKADAAPQRAERRKKGRPTRKKKWNHLTSDLPEEEWFEGEALEELLEDPEKDFDEPEEPAPASDAPPPTPGDLHVPGALGPETHTYGQMALHLYMRERAPSDAATEPPKE